MSTPPKDPGFDAFFDAITSSPKFSRNTPKSSNPQNPKALEDSLREMEATIAQASEMLGAFDSTFATPEVKKAGEDLKREDTPKPLEGGAGIPESKTGNPKDEEEKLSIEVKYFTKKDDATWGFHGIAGMADLKKELEESFIKPLRFKFLIEKLQKEKKEATVPENTQNDTKDKNSKPTDSREDLYHELYSVYEKFKIAIPTGLMFYGPPGTGKTFITKKLAEELGAGMIEKSVGEFGSSYLHQTSQNIRAFFRDAKKASEKGAIILFLDEIDSLVSKRTDRVDANKAEEISQFLQEFNALSEAPNLIVIAATNRPDHLDPAILRSGRLDKKIYIGPPDAIARKELFEIYIERSGRPHAKLDYQKLSELTDGYVAADIEAICDDVARDASQSILEMAKDLEDGEYDAVKIRARLDDHKITMKLLEKAITDTTSSLKMVDMGVYEGWLESIK